MKDVIAWLRTRSLLMKMIAFTSIAVLLLVSILAAILYGNARSLLGSQDSISSRKIVYQVNYNLSQMNESIVRLTQSFYLNPDISDIMFGQSEDMSAIALKMNKASSTVTSANLYVHSISVYNPQTRSFYNTGSPVFFDDPLIKALFDEDTPLPKLKPVYRNLGKLVNGREVGEPVFSYFMFEKPENGSYGGAVVINIKAEWILDSLHEVNMIDPGKGAHILIMDRDNRLINTVGDIGEQPDWLKEALIRRLSTETLEGEQGSFVESNNNKEYLITYADNSSMGMTFLKIQPALEVYHYLNSFKSSILFITAVFLGASIIVSVLVARRLYMPIGRLVKLVSDGKDAPFVQREHRDEISYLDHVFKQSMTTLQSYQDEHYQYRDVKKHYWLRRFLTEKLLMNWYELEEVFARTGIILPRRATYAVVLLKIDDYSRFREQYSTKVQEAIRFALLNIVSEWLSPSFANEGLDLKEDHVGFIVGVPDDTDFPEDLIPLLEQARQTVRRFYKLSFTVSISRETEEFVQLFALYNQTLNQSSYRFQYGHGAILHPDSCNFDRSSGQSEVPSALIRQLHGAMIGKEAEDARACLTAIFEKIRSLEYQHALTAIFALIEAVKKSLDIEGHPSSSSLLIELSSLSLHLSKKETLNEIEWELSSIVKKALQNETKVPVTVSLDAYVVETVANYIWTNYSDPGICLASIASMMKISSRKLGNLFKAGKQMSVADYINETRLLKASELLLEQNSSIRGIVERIGVANETYFFSLFKKKFGVTPKEYVLKHYAEQTAEAPRSQPDRI
ncbi:AraC family transcriptional regulator [Cohnella silvisoli]|uniref:AraC family transcriptional regulator n=1 Tax=Cohnella silvisoli TaxID=2873699 RepID=A0ABV1KZY3_9BACL|nr:AraC family transcriptional regulator [Cohnella silvisoli]MCD9024930.1 AraC family transcriptional regulator [Cohnella silvisoli]